MTICSREPRFQSNLLFFLPSAVRVRFDSAISSFESQPTKFVPPRSQGKSTPISQAITLAKLLRSQSTSDLRKPLNPCKIAPQPEHPVRNQSCMEEIQDWEKWVETKINEWEQDNLIDKELWEQYQDDFNDWTEKDFKSDVSNTLLRRLRDTLRRRGVWVSRDEQVAKSLYNTLQEKNPPRWTEKEVLRYLPYENFISITIKIFLKTNFGRKPSPPVPPRPVLSSPPSKRQSTSPPRFPKFFQSPKFPSVFNRQLYSELPPIPPYRRPPTSSPISPRLPPQTQLEEQPVEQPDEQPGGQSGGQSGEQPDGQLLRQPTPSPPPPENQLTGRQSPPTTENLEHPDGPSVESPDGPLDGPPVRLLDGPPVRLSDGPPVGSPDGPLVGSSDGPSVEQSFKPPTPSPLPAHPSAPPTPVNQPRGQSFKPPRPSAPLTPASQSMGRAMSQLMGRLMGHSMGQLMGPAKFIQTAIHVRCGIG